jgi:hypothetical protein
MYLRFVVPELDEESERGLGVFHAAYNLCKRGELYPHEETHLEELRHWFNVHLEKPTCFTAAKPPYYRKKKKAVSWFKDTAQSHISRIHEMIAILSNHGISVRMVKAERVGYVVYEDDHQIVAEPFSDTDC